MKLRTEDQVLFWDGSTLLELTTVVQVNKEKSQVKLSNGVTLEREPIKKGYFKRADKSKRDPAKAWKYGEGDTKKWWEAYLFKRRSHLELNTLDKKISQIGVLDILEDSGQVGFLLNVQRKLGKL